jgi:hypothetical protein
MYGGSPVTRLSPASILAWKIARFEALRAGSRYLEKEHLFIGLCSLEKVLSVNDLVRHRPVAQSVLYEKDTLDLALKKTRMDAATFRQKVRNTLPRGEGEKNAKVIHRSPDCRTCFDLAAAHAKDKEITCIYLLDSIFENPGPIILNVLTPVSGRQERTNHPPVVLQMSRTLRKFLDNEKQKQHLQADITRSRNTLESLPAASERSVRLRMQLRKKTIRIARLSLIVGDLAGMIAALRDLADNYGIFPEEIKALCAQLEYMHSEGISLGESSRERIRAFLDGLEQAS